MPTEQIEADFLKAEKARIQREIKLKALHDKKEREDTGRYIDMYLFSLSTDDDFYSYGNIRTMTEPRPNAYMPETVNYGELPIPKPYGAHAPFKPQEPGSQMRHYKKPTVKPVEI